MGYYEVTDDGLDGVPAQGPVWGDAGPQVSVSYKTFQGGAVMGYVTQNLVPGERVVFQTRIHPIIFAEPVVFIVFGLWLLTVDWIVTGLIMIGLAVWWALTGWIHRATSEFAVTDKRLIAKVGLISRRTVEMHLTKIESLAIDQPVLGRLLGFGTVRCRGTGAGDQEFKRVAKAMLVRRHVYEQAEQLAQRENAPR